MGLMTPCLPQEEVKAHLSVEQEEVWAHFMVEQEEVCVHLMVEQEVIRIHLLMEQEMKLQQVEKVLLKLVVGEMMEQIYLISPLQEAIHLKAYMSSFLY